MFLLSAVCFGNMLVGFFLSVTMCKNHTHLMEIFTFKIGQVPVLLGTAS